MCMGGGEDDCTGCRGCNYRHVGLDYAKPRHFATSQWPGWGCGYMLLRIAIAIYFSVWFALSLTGPRTHVTWLIFLTNWTFLLFTLTQIMHAIIAIEYYLRVVVWRMERPRTMPCHYQFFWVIYNISSNNSFITAGFFWTLFFLGAPGFDSFDAVSIHNHGITVAVNVVDSLFISAVPLRLLHYYQPVLYSLVYFSFTAVYQVAGGVNMNGDPGVYYPTLNWERERLGNAFMIMLVMSFVIVPVVWLIQVALYRIRLALAWCCCSPLGKEEQEDWDDCGGMCCCCCCAPCCCPVAAQPVQQHAVHVVPPVVNQPQLVYQVA